MQREKGKDTPAGAVRSQKHLAESRRGLGAECVPHTLALLCT